MSNFDLYLFGKVHALWLSWNLAIPLAWFSAKFLMYAAVEGVLLWSVFGFNRGERKKRMYVSILALFAGLVSRFGVTELIRLLAPRPRPYAFFNFYPLVNEPFLDSASFPSGHMAFFFAFAMVIFLYWRKLGAGLFAAGILVGLARIYAGVHWPSDILMGAVLGILVGYATDKLITKRYGAHFLGGG